MQLSHATNFGECISSHQCYFHIDQKSEKTGLSPHQPASLQPVPEITIDYFQCLDVSLAHHPHSEALILNELSLNCAGYEDHKPCIPLIIAVIYPSLDKKLNQISTFNTILDPMFDAKEPCPHHQCNYILGRNFGVPAQITATSWHGRHVTDS